MGSEAPGLGGVPGVAKGTTRAPKAWADLMRTMTTRAPAQLRRAERARLRMLRARR